MGKEKITILCSGVTLGIYVPALVVNYQLTEKGFDTDVVVLEELFFNEKKDKIPDTKAAFHKNFAFALMGQRFTKGVGDSLDPVAVNNIFNIWKEEKRRRFLVFSGFWIPIIERYIEQVDFQDLLFYLCHMDTAIAASWKSHEIVHPYYQNIWLFNWEKNNISYFIDISGELPIPFNKRKNRIILHGGGWGIGTYKDTIPKLVETGITLDVIAYEENDLENKIDSYSYFLINPEWKAWEKDEHGNHRFPPLGEVKDNQKIEYLNNEKFSEVYKLIQQNRAIISKPGGATLIDSLSSATPVIFLDPFGKYEEKNALLWEYLDFGISFPKWIESDYSMNVIENMHKNILNIRSNIKNFMEIFDATKNNCEI